MSFATTKHMQSGGEDFRERLTLVFIPGNPLNYHEVFCLKCSSKLMETNNDIAYVTDVSDTVSLSENKISTFDVKCPGHCRTWYSIKSEPGQYIMETTKIFFIGYKRYREVHCYRCRSLLCTITSGNVHSPSDPHRELRRDEKGFVPTFCLDRKCGREFEISTL